MLTIYIIKKPKLSIRVLQVLRPQDFDLQDLIPLLKFSGLEMLFNDDGRICQSLFPTKSTVSMPYVVFMTIGKSV